MVLSARVTFAPVSSTGQALSLSKGSSYFDRLSTNGFHGLCKHPLRPAKAHQRESTVRSRSASGRYTRAPLDACEA